MLAEGGQKQSSPEVGANVGDLSLNAIVLLRRWTGGLPLLASGFPKRKGLLVRVQRLQSSRTLLLKLSLAA